MTLTTHHLIFTAETVTPLALEAQSGAALRGAISNALWDRFCANKAAPTCAGCPLVQVCPVAALVAPMRAEDEKGGDQRPRDRAATGWAAHLCSWRAVHLWPGDVWQRCRPLPLRRDGRPGL